MPRIDETPAWIVTTLYLHGGRLSINFANPEEAPNPLHCGVHPIVDRRKENSCRTIELGIVEEHRPASGIA